ncbi:MAG: Gfo/Idh/MocA family oxidoreductase [Sedimentisphaerales bacterium]|nr:Gfo/Idh/MocA family oxidoreductase [Sedimentisphaerales bacterium]
MHRNTKRLPVHLTRRNFLHGLAGALAGPSLAGGGVFGNPNDAGNKITIGCIGVGRMGLGDLRELMGFSQVQIVAVCDVDARRAAFAQQLVESNYASRAKSGAYKGCARYGDFRELVARPDIDAVSIVTPDHWHVPCALAAARAGKDIFLQKPLSLTLAEGRILSDTVRRYRRVLLVGSQQRSSGQFRFGCELVRNGRIGKLHTVHVAFDVDPAGTSQPAMPVPDGLDYDMWLGPAPWAPYTETRVHPQKGYGRPGWLRIADYGAGMITGWGSHHLDIAQWGMGTEYTGPVEIEGAAEYPSDGIWNVHGPFRIEYTYANGVKVICADNRKIPQGITFLGSEGWVAVRRGQLDAHPKSLLDCRIGPDQIRLYASRSHKGNFLECIRSRRESIAPVEIGHRSCSVCLLGEIAMRLGRRLRWDPDRETFPNDSEANRMLYRSMRSPWHL